MNEQINHQPEPSVPVVKVLSVRGVEYGLMTFMVWFGSAALLWCALAIIEGQAGFDVLAFPVALLIAVLPVFGYLFIRLRRAELANPKLRFEPSKRRFSQITQFVSFFVVFFSFVSFVYDLLSKAGGSDDDTSLGKSALYLLVFTVIYGGIFAYYWLDEHRGLKN